MRRSVAFACLALTGCSTLVLRDDGGTEPFTPDDTDVAQTDTDLPSDEPVVTVCATLPAPVGVGACELVPGSGDGLLIQGTVLGADQTFVGGAVQLDAAGLITCVGCDCADSAPSDTPVVRCTGSVVSPGLVNAHDHLTFDDQAPLALDDTRYNSRQDWRGEITTPINAFGKTPTSPGMRWVELRQAMSGTVSVAGAGSATGMLRNPDDGDDDLPPLQMETFPLGDSDRNVEPNCTWNYADSERQVADMPSYHIHVAEGVDDRAHEEFRCQSSSLDGAQDFTEPNTAQVHDIALTAVDYNEVAQSGTTLVWSPRSNVSLYGFTANVRLLDVLGGRVALGTDWTYSGSMSMLRELRCADAWNRQRLDGWFSDRDLLDMATIHAARAVGADGSLGSLEVGKLGDIAVFNGADVTDPADAARAVVDASATDVLLVLRGGVPLFGDEAVVTGLDDTCDALEVCGKPRAACTRSEYGVPLATLTSSVVGAYPLFTCDDTPEGEPTCVPSRPGEFSGQITPSDSDGDGLTNGSDKCPTVFDPPRPMDDGAQPDLDGDGVGDACDPTPLPADIDSDGVVNEDDVCPTIADPTQADADNDLRGDECDACPDDANPVGLCPAPSVTIVQLRTTQSVGDAVTTEGVVTAVGDYGFWMQDPSVASGANAGIRVELGSAPTVALHHRVRVSGTIDEYFGELELSAGGATDLGATTPVAPIGKWLADATTEAFEGTLVTISTGTVTDTTYDCAVDNAACHDTGLWEIGGASGVVVSDAAWTGGAWSSKVGVTPVTGVMQWRYDRRRILPRDASDFGP
jgi:cytosine/adenosine deaminase-related metal-dependent hydrolase